MGQTRSSGCPTGPLKCFSRRPTLQNQTTLRQPTANGFDRCFRSLRIGKRICQPCHFGGRLRSGTAKAQNITTSGSSTTSLSNVTRSEHDKTVTRLWGGILSRVPRCEAEFDLVILLPFLGLSNLLCQAAVYPQMPTAELLADWSQ